MSANRPESIHRRAARSRFALPVAILLVLGVVAAGCGDDDGGGGDGGDADTPTLGVLSGAVEDGYAVDIGVPGGQLSRFDTTADMVDALRAGRIDAFALTSITVREQADAQDGIEATEGFVPEIDGEEQLGCGAYVFRFGDRSLRDAFNEELNKMKEAGEILPLVEEFGFTEDELEPAVGTTVADLTGQPYDAAAPDAGDDTSLEDAKANGISLAFADERPYGFEDPSTGEASGQSPTVAAAVLERLGITVNESTVVDFGALINGLNAETYDLIAAGMFVNEERTSQALFTDPDYCAATAFAVAEGNPHDISRFEDFIPEG